MQRFTIHVRSDNVVHEQHTRLNGSLFDEFLRLTIDLVTQQNHNNDNIPTTLKIIRIVKKKAQLLDQEQIQFEIAPQQH